MQAVPYTLQLADGTSRTFPVRPAKGDIGEGSVLDSLTRRGYEAVLTREGSRGVDIEVTGPISFDVQVKTATGPSWSVTSKDDSDAIPCRPDLFFALVELHEGAGAYVARRTFVVPSQEVRRIAAGQFETWRATRPQRTARGRYIKERPARGIVETRLVRYENAWDLLPASDTLCGQKSV